MSRPEGPPEPRSPELPIRERRSRVNDWRRRNLQSRINARGALQFYNRLQGAPIFSGPFRTVECLYIGRTEASHSLASVRNVTRDRVGILPVPAAVLWWRSRGSVARIMAVTHRRSRAVCRVLDRNRSQTDSGRAWLRQPLAVLDCAAIVLPSEVRAWSCRRQATSEPSA
jgi:hypothetical protein